MTIKGKNMAVWVDGKVITGSTSCQLVLNCDLQEVSSPDTGTYKNYISGRYSWSVKTNHLLQTTNSQSFASLIGKKVNITFAKGSVKDGVWSQDSSNILKFSGSAIVSAIDIDADMGSYCKGSFKFTGTGALTPQSS